MDSKTELFSCFLIPLSRTNAIKKGCYSLAIDILIITCLVKLITEIPFKSSIQINSFQYRAVNLTRRNKSINRRLNRELVDLIELYVFFK